MKKLLSYKEPLSTVLRRHPHGSKTEIANTLRWVGFSSLGIFLVLIIAYLLAGNYLNALIVSIGTIPVVISLLLIWRDAVAVPSSILSITIILLITALATLNQGIYDVGILGYPVILIVAGLILRGRVIIYLAFLIIACMAWLVFGAQWNLYQPIYLTQANLEDFFFASIIMLIAGNAVYRLARNIYHNLSLGEEEIRMREQAEQEREIIIQQLKRKNQELDRFAVHVSHDLKTPLITLAGFLGYLERDINTGETQNGRKRILPRSMKRQKQWENSWMSCSTSRVWVGSPIRREMFPLKRLCGTR